MFTVCFSRVTWKCKQKLDPVAIVVIYNTMLNIEDTKLEKHSVTISGHRTSITLERGFWREVRRIAESRGVSLNELVRQIDEARGGGLSSALRMLVLQDLTSD